MPQSVQEAIENALDRYAISGIGDVKKLQGMKEIFRLRVGKYRVFFTEDRIVINVIYAGKRETTTYR